VYSVLEHSAETEENMFVQELIAWKLEQYPALAKIIIYSNSIDSIEEIEAKLDCYIYYTSVESSEVKSYIQKQWERVDRQVIIASNVFELEIDKLDVWAVVYTEPIYQVCSYRQESSWARQDRQPSKAIIIVRARKQKTLQNHHIRLKRQSIVYQAIITEADRKRIDQDKVNRFISGAQCRRVSLDQEIDS
jgi:superfamily II DNA helicase RecQ